MKIHSAVILALVVLADSSVGAQDGPSARPSLLRATFGKLPIYFVENRGVYPDDVAYYIQGVDKTLFFTRDGITFRLKGEDQNWVVKLEFVGANRVTPRGEDLQQAVFSYFKGPKKTWKTGLRTFSKIVYHDLWPGIDLVYRGTVNQLKYEFVVKPGADPGKIRLRYRGVESLERTANGSLSVNTPAGGFEDAPPKAWQEIEGQRVSVETAYRLDPFDPQEAADDAEFGFAIGMYDRKRPLVLDPAVLVYCGYIGGTSFDGGTGIAVDKAGNAYVTGTTLSDQKTFPVTVGPDLTYNGPGWDAFVAKVNPQGTALLYCGYIGGAGDEDGVGIAVDQVGNAYVTGNTNSNQGSFPVTVGPDLTYNDNQDVFVAKVNAQGTALVYCGYIGGGQNDYAKGIAVDQFGNAYVTGDTHSDHKTFPVKVGPDVTYNGGRTDAFIAKVNAQGTALVYCGYLGGGSDDDYGYGTAVDGTGNAYVTGRTASNEQTFPVKGGPGLTYNGGGDAFVAKIDQVDLSGSGPPRPGNAIVLDLFASNGVHLPYQLGSSLGTGPISIGNRKLDLSPDDILSVSVLGLWPQVFQSYQGLLDAQGRAKAAIHIPNVQALIGLRIHTAFVTLDPQAPSGIRSISNTETFTISK